MDYFKEIPTTWIIAFLAVALVCLRFFSIDTWTTGALGIIIGYLTGKHVESTKAAVLIPIPMPKSSV